MHDHGAMGADAGQQVNLLPFWLQVMWVVALGAVTAGHLVTLARSRGEAIAWSSAQTATAAGMLYMFSPWAGTPVPGQAVAAAFGALFVFAVAISVRQGPASRRMRLGRLMVSVDLAAMAYMLQLGERGIAPLTYLLVAYYCALAVASAGGILPMGRGSHATMATGMAWMLLAMQPPEGELVGRVLSNPVHSVPVLGLLLLAGLLVRAVNQRESEPVRGRAGAHPASSVRD
jgi:hypothetical protein